VAALGGTAKVLEQGSAAAEQGDYRWAVELLQQLVFAEPDNAVAKELLARCHEQLGYRAESATWRNSYLTAALELRQGVAPMSRDVSAMAEMTAQIPTERFLEVLATRLDAVKAADRRFVMNLALDDVGERYVIWLENAVLHFRKAPAQDGADVSLSLTRPTFLKLLSGADKEGQAPAAMKIEGDRAALGAFLKLFDASRPDFPIVTR